MAHMEGVICSKEQAMAERLEVHVFNMYEGCALVCEVNIRNDQDFALKSWTTDDPREMIHMGIDSTDDSIFDKVRMKQHLDKVFDLFEPKKITIKGT